MSDIPKNGQIWYPVQIPRLEDVKKETRERVGDHKSSPALEQALAQLHSISSLGGMRS